MLSSFQAFFVVVFMQTIIFDVNFRPDIPVSHDICLMVLFIADENNSDNHKRCRVPFALRLWRMKFDTMTLTSFLRRTRWRLFKDVSAKCQSKRHFCRSLWVPSVTLTCAFSFMETSCLSQLVNVSQILLLKWQKNDLQSAVAVNEFLKLNAVYYSVLLTYCTM